MSSHSPNLTPRILVIDDDEGLLFLMTDALRQEGYHVEGFDTGTGALDWLKRETPDLLVLDLKLGDLSAPELLQRVSERGPRPPFIVVTGNADERFAAEMTKLGALDYVMKDSAMLERLPNIVRLALDNIERDRTATEAANAVEVL